MKEPTFIPYGPLIGDEEHYRQVVALHKAAAKDTSRQGQAQLRRDELNLTIDHKLGVHFPSERREAVWAVQERLQRWRLPMLMLGVGRKMLSFMGFKEDISAPFFRMGKREMEKVLSPDEARVMLDLAPEENGPRP